MKISTATSVFVNYALQDATDQVIQAGFDGIDLWCGRPHLFRQDYPLESLRRLRKKLEDNKLTPVSLLPAIFRYPFSLSSPIEAIQADSFRYMQDCIDNARLLGCGQVLVVPSRSLWGQAQEDAANRFASSLAELCPYAEARGVRLGIEVLYPQISDYMNTTEAALRLIEQIGSPCLGVVLDSGHLNLSGEPVESALRNVGDRLLQVHVNDNDAKQQQNAIPGEGSFDFLGLVASLRQVGYTGFLTLELGYSYSFDPFPAACAALERVRGYLNT